MTEVGQVGPVGRRRGMLNANTKTVRPRMPSARSVPDGFIGGSPPMLEVYRAIHRAARGASTVLLLGETGTGKELAAAAIHRLGVRKDRPFVVFNCSAITETLLDSELFGHARGAFTGADRSKKGLFEAADGGTIFLDEIGDIPRDTQVRLLRVLQEGEIRRVGSTKTIKIDVRVVAATHVDLLTAIDEGRFRSDLYYRLNVVPIRLPPLRERGSDFDDLLFHFCDKIRSRMQAPEFKLEPAAVEFLRTLPWPGNVRELAATVEQLAAASEAEMGVVSLTEAIRILGNHGRRPQPTAQPQSSGAPSVKSIDIDEHRKSVERSVLAAAMAQAGNNRKLAARLIGIAFSSLIYKLREHGIDPPTPGTSNPRPSQASIQINQTGTRP